MLRGWSTGVQVTERRSTPDSGGVHNRKLAKIRGKGTSKRGGFV